MGVLGGRRGRGMWGGRGLGGEGRWGLGEVRSRIGGEQDRWGVE